MEHNKYGNIIMNIKEIQQKLSTCNMSV